MKSLPFIVAVAALCLGAAEITSAEAKVVQISKRYSKIEIDEICARHGGAAFGTTEDLYGCAKGSNAVACDKDGACTGYLWLSAAPSADIPDRVPIRNWDGNAELVLQMPMTLPRSGMDGSLGTAQ